MALIACSECGRAVSDKAAVCIGCGAPLTTSSPIDLVPRRSNALPPTREQIKRRARPAPHGLRTQSDSVRRHGWRRPWPSASVTFVILGSGRETGR